MHLDNMPLASSASGEVGDGGGGRSWDGIPTTCGSQDTHCGRTGVPTQLALPSSCASPTRKGEGQRGIPKLFAIALVGFVQWQ